MLQANRTILAVVLTAVAMVATAQGASPVVRLWPQALVQGDRVRVADVAGVTGLDEEQTQAAMAVDLGLAPAPGQDRHVDIERVREALTAAKVNLAMVSLTGAASCRVYRPAEARTERDPAKGKPRPAEGSGSQTLGDAVRRFVEKRAAGLGGQVEVRFGAANQHVLALSGEGMSFAVRARSTSPLGLVSLDVDVLEAGVRSRTIPVVAEVALLKHVVVARRPINRGASVRAEDVVLEQRRFTRSETIGLADLTAAVGREAKRYVERGEMLTGRDVQPLPLVKRGDYVTVYLRQGGILVRGSAKALAGGVQGERIEVKAEPGGQVYAAVVTGPKTVQADANGALLSRAR